MYTQQHAEAIRALGKPPLPITMDIVQLDDNEIHVVVYQEQVMSYDYTERVVLMTYLRRVKQTLQDMGLVVELEGRTRPQ
jgi:hypothetical protein